jgi:hypothetical protein
MEYTHDNKIESIRKEFLEKRIGDNAELLRKREAIFDTVYQRFITEDVIAYCENLADNLKSINEGLEEFGIPIEVKAVPTAINYEIKDLLNYTINKKVSAYGLSLLL